MSPKSHTSRSRLVVTIVALASLAVAATAGAAVYVYSNGFGSHGAYKQIKQIGAGKKACQEKYVGGSNKMSVTYKNKRFCSYKPPVEADSDQPDHEVIMTAKFKRNNATKRAKKAAYLAVRVRAGGASSYELQVHPVKRTFVMLRNGQAAGLPGGETNAVKPLGKDNTLRLRSINSQVTAFVNGERVGNFVDPNPNQVTGRRVNFGPGFSQDVPRGPIAFIGRVQVGVPNP